MDSKRRVVLGQGTLVLGIVAVVATTVAGTMVMNRGTASARKFQPASGALVRTHINARASKQAEIEAGLDAGIMPPTGYTDPLRISGAASKERIRWFREAELKHGRIAMLAAVGFLVGENPELNNAIFPGKASSLSVNAFTDHNLDGFWYSFLLGCGLLESRFFGKMQNGLDWKLKDDYAVGDLGFDPLGWKPEDPAALESMLGKELQNGRLAMLALAGFNAAELTDGKPIFPIHPPSSSAAELSDLNGHLEKGLDLVKEMGQMLAESQS